MLRNVLAGIVTLSVLASPVAAKPPGLPVNLEDRLAPVIAPWQAWNDQMLPVLAAKEEPAVAPVPLTKHTMPAALGRMPVGVRKQVVGCVLFGIHPLMMLSPVDDLLDQPCDHPETKPTEPIGIHFSSHGILQVARPTFLTATDPAIYIEMPPVDITRSVLENLNKLLEADELHARGEKHLAAGRLGEALDCFTRAAECCPGSQSSLLAQAAIHRVFARLYRPVGGTEEAEVKTPTEPVKPRKTRKERKEIRAKKKAAKQTPPTIINGVVFKPQVPAVAPGANEAGPKRLEVPAVEFRLRVEEQSIQPDGLGGTEEAEEPWWFLPWFEDWSTAGRTT